MSLLNGVLEGGRMCDVSKACSSQVLRKSNLSKYLLSRNRHTLNCMSQKSAFFFFLAQFLPNESEGTSYSVTAERKTPRSGEGNYSSVVKIEVCSECRKSIFQV